MSIGDFSASSGLSPKRLRTYAAIGLLTPAAVDPDTAYRYYSSGQLGDARLIDALRDAGIRVVLTRALGVGPEVPLDSSSRPVTPGDRLLLCSDGLFNHVPDDELAEVLRAGNSPRTAVDILLELGLARGGEDNLSVVVTDVRA